jgi:hypothetical protein
MGNALPAKLGNPVTFFPQDLINGSEHLQGSNKCSYSYAAPLHIRGGDTTIMKTEKDAKKFYFCKKNPGSESSRSEGCKGGRKSMQNIVDDITNKMTKDVQKKRKSVKKLNKGVLNDLSVAFETSASSAPDLVR